MKREVSPYLLALLAAGFVLWVLPFFLRGPQSEKPGTIDRRARWGIALEAVGFAIVFQPFFWQLHPAGTWRIVLGSMLLALAVVLSWTGRRALGKQWRIDAGLNASHDLIRSGPYRFIRHPIYASMLCLLLGDGLLLSKWWALLTALAIFLTGTEVRVHIEDRLLSERFGAGFDAYQQAVRAYIPLLR
jgi:protein-S-isoprenylcysteine O-methyltransferase Ste14